MARKVLLLWLLHFLLLLGFSASAGSDTSLDNCIYFDMENVEELISTLRTAKSPESNAFRGGNGDKDNLRPFGSLQSDWYRLHLLHDALPEESLLKTKFNHLFRLLTIAHDQATQFLLSSESTKLGDTSPRQTTISLANEDSTNVEEVDRSMNGTQSFNSESQENREKLKTPLVAPITSSIFAENDNGTNTNSSAFDHSSSSPQSFDDGLVSSAVESTSTMDLDPPVKPSITTAETVPTLADTEVNSTRKPTNPVLAVEFSTPFEKYTTPSINGMQKEDFKEFPARQGFPSVEIIVNTTTVAEIPWWNSTSSKDTSIFTTEDTEIDSSPRPVVTATVASNFVFEKNQIYVSIASDIMDPTTAYNLAASSVKEEESVSGKMPTQNISSSSRLGTEIEEYSVTPDSKTKLPSSTEHTLIVTPTIEKNEDNKLTDRSNRTETSLSEKSAKTLLTTRDFMESTSSVNPTIENNDNNKLTTSEDNQMESSISEKSTVISTTRDTFTIEEDDKNHLTSRNNETESLLNVKLTPNLWSVTDSTKNMSSVITFNVDKNDDNKLQSQYNRTGISKSENSTAYVRETADPIKSISKVTPSVEEEKKNNFATRNDETGIAITVKSSAIGWRSTDATESVPISNQEIQLTSQNNETKVSVSDSTFHNSKDASNSPGSTPIPITLRVSTSTAKLEAETEVINASIKITQNSLSTELLSEERVTESSTGSYTNDRLTIATAKTEDDISTDGEPKKETEKPNETTEKNKFENTSKLSSGTAAVTESSEPLSRSASWPIKPKPHFVKNPLNTGSSRSNNIFRNFKHGSDDFESEKSVISPEIVLYESGAGAKTGSVWRPQLMRQPPVGNNIWRFDNLPKDVAPYGHSYGQPAAAPPVQAKDGKAGRINLLRSRKRGSANADIEKQFRWFYREGHVGPAQKSRDKEIDNAKIKIQCKKAQ